MPEKEVGSDPNLQKLMEAAHKDRHLKLQLLENPKKVAEEWGVKLEPREVERLTKLGAFVELINEARFGSIFRACNPRICYPSTVWVKWEVFEFLKDYLVPSKIDWVFYPPQIFDRLDRVLDRSRNIR